MNQNDCGLGSWRYRDIDAAFRARVSARRDTTALVFESLRWTFGELGDRVDRISAWLIAQDVVPGDRIAWWGKNHADYLALVLSCARVGSVLVVVNWRLAEREVNQVFEDSEPRWTVVSEEFVERAPPGALVAGECTGGLPPLSSLTANPPTEWPEVRPDRPFLQLYTSGTTGRPKGVPQNHINHLAAYRSWSTSSLGEWDTSDRCLVCLPVFHATGTNFSLFSLLQGATLYLLREFSLDGVRDALGSGGITRLPLVPTMIDMLVTDPIVAAQDHSSLRLMIYGGSSISLPVLQRARAVFGCDFAQCYAATETTAAGTCLSPEDHRGDSPPLRSCGRPMKGLSVRIIDADCHEVPDGTVGEIAFSGPSIVRGYWNRAQETAKAFVAGWYMTGDAGFRDADGFITIVDRIRDMMISGGENVYPSEVESALATHPDVATVAVVGAPDARWGHRIVAAIVPRAECEPLTLDVLRVHLDPLIARYKHPRQLLLIDVLPRNPTGKVLRQQLIERAVAEWRR